MVPFFSAPELFTGPVAAALGGADLSFFVGLPVAGAAYLLLCRSVDLDAERAVAESEAADLERAAAAHELP